jgi:hypothetical protein
MMKSSLTNYYGSSGFDVKQGSEIAPRRRGGRRVKNFLFNKFSELRELCASVVNTRFTFYR